ncbi:MAG: homoserine O-succinyltransferase [Clostridiales bacterium]|nr:homoserine O-succinyltransferase [Clostridiales bacterium]
MPIIIPDNLPAFSTLEQENIFVIPNNRAYHQDIRALKIGILNLMPNKIVTETQILRLLSNTPLHVDIELIQVATHKSKNTSKEHMLTFYKTFNEIRDNKYDGFIITGAPIEHLEFEEVDYWDELCEIMAWTKTNVFSTIHICWGAMAALYYHYGVPKYPLNEKMFGVFPHKINFPNHPLLKGFDDCFYVPHSRYTEILRKDIDKVSRLEILTESSLSGVHIVADINQRQFFISGHSEYDRYSLGDEYFRDLSKGLLIQPPFNYFPDDDAEKRPNFLWRCHANLMFSNWLNYCVYQLTPYDLKDLDNMVN